MHGAQGRCQDDLTQLPPQLLQAAQHTTNRQAPYDNTACRGADWWLHLVKASQQATKPKPLSPKGHADAQREPQLLPYSMLPAAAAACSPHPASAPRMAWQARIADTSCHQKHVALPGSCTLNTGSEYAVLQYRPLATVPQGTPDPQQQQQQAHTGTQKWPMHTRQAARKRNITTCLRIIPHQDISGAGCALSSSAASAHPSHPLRPLRCWLVCV